MLLETKVGPRSCELPAPWHPGVEPECTRIVPMALSPHPWSLPRALTRTETTMSSATPGVTPASASVVLSMDNNDAPPPAVVAMATTEAASVVGAIAPTDAPPPVVVSIDTTEAASVVGSMDPTIDELDNLRAVAHEAVIYFLRWEVLEDDNPRDWWGPLAIAMDAARDIGWIGRPGDGFHEREEFAAHAIVQFSRSRPVLQWYRDETRIYLSDQRRDRENYGDDNVDLVDMAAAERRVERIDAALAFLDRFAGDAMDGD